MDGTIDPRKQRVDDKKNHLSVLSLSIKASRVRPRLRLAGDHVPAVDASVTTCGEDIDVVMYTVKAACVIEYPQDRFKVFLIDE